MNGYEFGLLLGATSVPSLALVLALGAAWSRGDGLAERLRAAALWSVCGLALLTASVAVTGTAETMNLSNVVLAQENTSLYALLQPVAAAVYLVALVLAAEDAALEAVLGPPARARTIGLLLLTLPACALGAVLFLGGSAGPALPGVVWLALKAGVVFGLLFLVRRRFAVLVGGARFAVAWVACLVALLNLGITVLRAGT